MSRTAPKVAVSYAWKEEQGGEASRTVEALCARLQNQGISVLWDKEGLRLGEDIRDFMRRIGTADFLCVFLSDAYLRSANCMNELLIAWESSQNRPGEFKERVRVWIMPSAKGIFRLDGRLTYTEYWQAECAKLQPLVSRNASRGLHGEDLNQFNRMKQYAEKTNEVLAFLSNKLAPQDFTQFEAWVCSLLQDSACAPDGSASGDDPAPPAKEVGATESTNPLLLSSELDGRLQEVFGTQYKQLSNILERRQELRAVLAVRFGLGTLSGDQLTAALIVEFHRAFLKALGEFGQIIDDDPTQRDAILELVSTVLFLAMAPQYAQALLHQTDVMEFQVAEDARQGIAEMLLCWTRRKGRRPVPVAALSREKASSGWESTPQMELSDLKRELISRLNLDATKPDVEQRLEEELERRANFGHPVMQEISAKNKALFDAVRRDTPLRNLLLLLKDTGNSINTHPKVGANYDRRFEDHLAELLKVALPPS
jgi:TIR domain